jgi:putative ubiquitin-RnfH superfamily antitoxin RatB of RatAB toxin-antitoxin module
MPSLPEPANSTPEGQGLLAVEVAYARPDEQLILGLDVEPGTRVEQAIRRSGILERFPEIDLERNKVGIFGKLTRLDAPLRDRDRVEIYRALIADPKEVRRQRAAQGKAMRKGGGKVSGRDSTA